jgi:6-phosphofructokinase 2
LIDEGVNVHPIQVIPNTRPSITLHVRDQNVNYRIVGASEPLGERDLAPVVGRLREIDPLPPYVILSGSFPPGVPVDLIAKTQAFCAERGVEFIVDTSGAPLLAAVEAGVMLVKPSKEELAAAVGAEPDDPTFDVPVAARSLVDRGVHNVVVSLGPDGCFVTTREGDEAYLTPPPATVVSTVGAGDSLLAGTVSGLSRGLPMIDAVRLGVAAGTATCTYPGSQLFTAGDIARLAPLVKVKRSRRG